MVGRVRSPGSRTRPTRGERDQPAVRIANRVSPAYDENAARDEAGEIEAVMTDESAGPSSALPPLARARLDELLEELLERVEDVVDSQERLRGLLDAVVAIASDLSLSGVLQRIVRVACQLSGARYGALGVLGSGPDRRLQEFVTHGLTEAQRARIGDLPRGHGLLGLIIDEPEPVRLNSIGDHPQSYGFPPNHPPMGTFLGVPIRTRENVFGNLYLTEKQGGSGFTEEDEELVVALAAAAGVVIENARLYEEAARRRRWLEAAAEITAALLGDVARTDALQLVADRALEVAEADVAVVTLMRDNPRRLVIEVVAGPVDEQLVGTSVAIEGSLSGQVVATGERLVVDDLATAGGREIGEGWPDLGPAMLLPLVTAGEVAGVLSVAWARERAHVFYTKDVGLPATFAEQAALALQVARAQEDRALLAVFEDRDRIGRDLHDLVIQRLFAIGLTLENAARLSTRPEVAQRITNAVDDLDATIKDIRRTIFELSAPPGSTDIRAELRSTLAVVAPALGFEPRLQTAGPVESVVPDQVRPHLLAVLREALSNVARHAGATSVDVRLEAGDTVVLTVVDDGKGIVLGDRESGLRNMRERAAGLGGSFDVRPGDGGGTTLVWEVPAR